MSLGLPPHLVPRALNRALAKSAHSIALAALVCAACVMLAFLAARPDLLIWPALLAITVMGASLWWVNRSNNPAAGIGYLAIGSICVYWHSLIFATQLPEIVSSSVLWLSLPKVALVMVAGMGRGLLPALVWAVSGYVLAEVSALVAILQSPAQPGFDIVTLGALVVALSVSILGYIATLAALRAQPRIHRAAREELIHDIRSRMELKAAALMHDTILSHLAAISASTSQRLPASLAEQMEHDLQILIGQEWLTEEAPSPATEIVADWRSSPLNSAIQEVRRQGLDVEGTGDFAAVARLDRARATALGLAAKQCLVNVIKHSGVMKAEVTVYGTASEVSVMVIDEGRGFDSDEVNADRLGLRASVRRRIEAVGGEVQVWSTPGAGTSILMRLPAANASSQQQQQQQEQQAEQSVQQQEHSARPVEGVA